MTSLLRLEGIVAEYGSFRALDEVSLDLAPGTLCALLGSNGSGKTTLMEVIAQLQNPKRGSYTTTLTRAAIGYCPQDDALWPDLSPLEHLLFLGRLYGASARSLKQRATDLLERLGLEGQRHQRTSTLSGGMRRRVALAASCIHEPRLLLLDEPTAGLDLDSAAAVHAFLRTTVAAGTAVLFSSHLLHEVRHLASRIVVLAGGRVVRDDSPTALFQRTASHRLELQMESASEAQALATALNAHATRQQGALLVFEGDGLEPLHAIGAEVLGRGTFRPLRMSLRPVTLEDLLDKSDRGLP